MALPDAMNACCPRLMAFLREHRRFLLWLAGLALFFFWLGAITPRVTMPGMCAVYG